MIAASGTRQNDGVEKELAALTNRQARIWVRFGVRIVVVAILSALLVKRAPFIAANRAMVDALSGVLVLWPLWTQLGQAYGERIFWGGQQAKLGNWAATQKLLAPFAAPPVSRLFDTTGEGTYFLACAVYEEGDTKRAAVLHAQNVRPTEWGEKSAASLQKIKGNLLP